MVCYSQSLADLRGQLKAVKTTLPGCYYNNIAVYGVLDRWSGPKKPIADSATCFNKRLGTLAMSISTGLYLSAKFSTKNKKACIQGMY